MNFNGRLRGQLWRPCGVYFITKPMFKAIDFFFHWTGNFDFAILIVTVLIKIRFLPLANKRLAE